VSVLQGRQPAWPVGNFTVPDRALLLGGPSWLTLNYKLLLLGENLYVLKVFKYIVEMLCVSLIDFPNQMAKVSILMTWGGVKSLLLLTMNCPTNQEK
jgi:hypothetical protein